MPGQHKRSKSASTTSRTLYFDKNDAKSLIEKKYGMCRSFDDLYNEEYIESGPLAKSNKSKNFLLKLISHFDKKNKYKLSGEKDANNEFLKQSFMKTSIPRIMSYYNDSSNKLIQPRVLTYDKIDKILSNKKPFLSKRYTEIFERKIEFDDSFLIEESISPIVNKINENKKENWKNTNEQWGEIVVNKKSNHKKTLKEMLSNLMRINKNVNKHKYENTQVYNKYEMDYQIYNLPVIPRVVQMISNDDNNKDKDNIDMNRSATIRPIYGIKRNQTTPVKSPKTILPKDITVDKKIPNYNNEMLSNEEYGENLIKPSAIKKLAKQFRLNSPRFYYRQFPPLPPDQNEFEYLDEDEFEYPNQDEYKPPNQNKHQTGNPDLNQPEQSIQYDIQKNHVDLCKLVLNQCRKENNSSHIRPYFSELNEVQTTKSDDKNIVERKTHQMTCECNTIPFKRFHIENV